MTIIFWTKTSSGSKMHDSKIHLSDENSIPFCGLDTFYYEFQSDAIIGDGYIDCARHLGYKNKAYDRMPDKYVCKKCLKSAKELLFNPSKQHQTVHGENTKH